MTKLDPEDRIMGAAPERGSEDTSGPVGLPHQLRAQLLRHEGLRLDLYACPSGKLTIGVGHNVEENGISEAVAMQILAEDIETATEDAKRYVGQPWGALGSVRIAVIVNMAFNLGADGLGEFHRLRQAIGDRDWEWAAKEMEESVWYGQVGVRAVELCRQMRTGSWQEVRG